MSCFHHNQGSNMLMSTVLILLSLPLVWSKSSDPRKESSTVKDRQQLTVKAKDIIGSSSHGSSVVPQRASSIGINSSVETIDLSSSHRESKFLHQTSTSSISNTLSSYPTSTITSTRPLIPSTPSMMINAKVPDSGGSIATSQPNNLAETNTIADPSLSNFNHIQSNSNLNVTPMINVKQLPNITSLSNFSSQSQSTSHQHQLQKPNDTKSQSIESQNFIEFIVMSSLGLLLAITLTVASVYCCIKAYHERYPVRIGFGRKFSTFENPIYTQKTSSTCEIDNNVNNLSDNQAGSTTISEP